MQADAAKFDMGMSSGHDDIFAVACNPEYMHC